MYPSADTVVLTHTTHAVSNVDPSLLPQERPEVLEKPISKADNLRMLLDLNGSACEVVTGVTLGTNIPVNFRLYAAKLIYEPVYPILTAPGYEIR